MGKRGKTPVDLTGQRFGILTVVGRAPDYISPKGNKTIKWKCRCDCGKEVEATGSSLKNGSKVSCGCLPKSSECYTAKDWQDWCNLYEYVKSNVMRYDENQQLSEMMRGRLQGLRKGKFIANKNTSPTAYYPFDVILNTFKFCMSDIRRALSRVSFEDDNKKFNYVMKIVESNINTVYAKMKKVKRAEEKMSDQDISNAANYVNRFKPRNRDNDVSKFNDIW